MKNQHYKLLITHYALRIIIPNFSFKILLLYGLLAFVITGCAIISGGGPRREVVDELVPTSRDKLWQKHVDAGNLALENNDLPKAIEEYKSALEIKPNSSDVHIKLAQIYTKQEEYELAQSEFREGLKLDPKNISARNYLGYLHETLGQYQQGAEQFETVLSYDPQNLYALNHLGLMYIQLKQIDKAEVVLRTALEIDPKCERLESKNIHNYFGLIHEDKGDIAAAIAEYRESIRLFPDDMWARKQLASLLEDHGRYYEAQLEYLQMLEIDPENLLAKSRLNALSQLTYGATAVTNVAPVDIVEDDIESIIANAPDANAYPDADAIILLNKFSHEVLESGRSRYTIHQVVKICTERGIQSYGEAVMPFKSRSQNIGANIARTILPDGTVVEAPDESFHDVTPPGLLDYNLFSDLMWKVIAMPSLQPGAIIEYQITVEDATEPVAGDRIWFWGGMAFQTTDPILKSKYALRVPTDLIFKWKTYNAEIEPIILHNETTTTYLWIYGETKAIQLELNMADISDVVPSLSYSSVQSWDDVASWYNELAVERYNTDEIIESTVARLIADAKTKGHESSDEEKIKAIYYFVASQIRYVGVEYGKGAYQPQYAQDVFKNRFGDCKDKTTLMIAMLKLAGIEGYPAMISPAPFEEIDMELPSPGQFSHVIVALKNPSAAPLTHPQPLPRGERGEKSDGNYIWLDPTSETCSYGDLPVSDQGRKAFVITNEGGVFVETPIYPASANKLSLFSEISLNADGSIHGKEHTHTIGQRNLEYRLLYKSLKPNETRDFFAAMFNHQFPAAKIENFSISDLNDMDVPVETSVEFSSPQYGMPLGDKLLFALPNDNLSTYATLVGPPERKYDLNLGYPMQLEKTVSVSIPEGYTVPSLPPDIELNEDFGGFKRSYKFENNMVKYEMDFTIRQSVVPPKKYQELKRFLEIVAREDKAQIVLERKISGL
jgi:tetratricopeptide (TPR) repeat protein